VARTATQKKRLAAGSRNTAPSEVGISGTTNWRGDPLAESNSNLLHQAAFGTPGTRTWGEWEKIARTDPDVSAVLDFIVSPLRDARVDVEAAEHEDIDPAVAQQQADFVRWCLLERSEPRWTETIQQMVRGSLMFGHSVHEVVLGQVEHPTLPAGVGVGLVRLAQRLPSSIHPTNGWEEAVLPDGRRELAVIRQVGQQGDKWSSNIELPADRVLLHSWNRDGNNYRGFSAFRAVWYVAKIREQLLKLVGISLVREGAGIPAAVSQGKDGTSLTPNQRKSLSRLLANLVVHENASVVMPNGWDIKWIYSPGANKGHVVETYNALGTLILRQLGAQQMALGTGSTGSRSVGEVHNQVAQAYIGGVRAGLEAVLNGTGDRPYTGLTRKLVDANWGPQPAYPTIKLTLQKPQLSGLEKMQAIGAAVTAGALTITTDDENTVREELGFGPIDDEARQALRTPPAPAPLPAILPKPQPGPIKQTRLTAVDGVFTPKRPLRPSEQRLDLARMDQFLNTARQRFEADVRPLVVEALVRAQPAIHAAMASGKPQDVAKVPIDFSRVHGAIKAFVDGARAEGAKNVKAELSKDTGAKVAKERAQGDQSMAPVRFAADEEDKDTAPVDDADAVAEAQQLALARRMEQRLRAELENEAIDAQRTGDSEGEVVSRTLANQLETGAFRADAGFVLTRAFNVGRDEAARLMGGVSEVEYSAILDGRQCDACDSMDGQSAPFGSAEHDALVPPNRDCDGGNNCRCILTYVPADNGTDDGADE